MLWFVAIILCLCMLMNVAGQHPSGFWYLWEVFHLCEEYCSKNHQKMSCFSLKGVKIWGINVIPINSLHQTLTPPFCKAKITNISFVQATLPSTKCRQHHHSVSVIGFFFSFTYKKLSTHSIFSSSHFQRGTLWPTQKNITCKMAINICHLFSIAGESLPLATSNQILIRFTSKGQSSSRGFHLAYQGERTKFTLSAPVVAGATLRTRKRAVCSHWSVSKVRIRAEIKFIAYMLWSMSLWLWKKQREKRKQQNGRAIRTVNVDLVNLDDA